MLDCHSTYFDFVEKYKYSTLIVTWNQRVNTFKMLNMLYRFSHFIMDPKLLYVVVFRHTNDNEDTEVLKHKCYFSLTDGGSWWWMSSTLKRNLLFNQFPWIVMCIGVKQTGEPRSCTALPSSYSQNTGMALASWTETLQSVATCQSLLKSDWEITLKTHYSAGSEIVSPNPFSGMSSWYWWVSVSEHYE